MSSGVFDEFEDDILDEFEAEEYYLDKFGIDHESDFERIGRKPHVMDESKAYVRQKSTKNNKHIRDLRKSTRQI